MFFSICQFIGMFVVLLHIPSLTAGYLYFYTDQDCAEIGPIAKEHLLSNVLKMMK
jgi:hypothetical protein